MNMVPSPVPAMTEPVMSPRRDWNQRATVDESGVKVALWPAAASTPYAM
jgi:hypothetical protein